MKRLSFFFTLTLVFIFPFPHRSGAEEGLKLIVRVESGRVYEEPYKRIIHVRTRKTVFKVYLENHSDGPESYCTSSPDEYKALIFELSNAKGSKKYVKRLDKLSQTTLQRATYMDEGEEEIFDETFTVDDWKGLDPISTDKLEPIRLRAIYRNCDGENIYSEYYDVVFHELRPDWFVQKH